MTPGEAGPAPPQPERAGPAPPPRPAPPAQPGRVGPGGLRQQRTMDVAVDSYLAVSLLFTVLALVLASVFVRLRGGAGQQPREAAEPAREGGPGPRAAAEGAGPGAGPEGEAGRVPVEEVGAGEEGKEAAGEPREAAAEPEPEPGPAAEPSPAAAESIPRQAPAERRQPGHREDAESKEEDPDSENEKLVVKEPGDEDAADETFSFKYSPGKLRGNQYKSMMTKEELEEEQRVQREQLAAIFRLMKEKSDTFGEMSEGDMKEQLRLYDI
ncbi:matrix-remodeling-associated protein 7 isoform X4 [Phalacrocorax carbo]|uniref:matrix-remodeling-associated protein 7 isoform X4 n=1 Tax=Phalacrocorax carbo TaxID=9209 RepID=UPI003119F6E0